MGIPERLQTQFAYGAGPRDVLDTLLRARAGKYLSVCSGDPALATRLYLWNIELVSAMWWCLHPFEVVLRNAVAGHLKSRYRDEWFHDPRFIDIASDTDKQRLNSARRDFQKKYRRDPSPDDMVASLSLGFWVSAISKHYDVALAWKTNFRAMAAHDPRLSRSEAHARAQNLQYLRNRLAHLEPVHHLDLRAYRGDALTITAAISPVAASWLARHCTLEDTLRRKPT